MDLIQLHELPIVLLTLSVGVTYTKFLLKMERRTNLVELDDPLFRYLPRYDTSIPVFLLLYTTMLTFLYNWYEWDNRKLCFSLMFIFATRSFVLWTHPFKGHKDMHPLIDPIIDRFLFGVSEPNQEDLSYSGHCATICLFAWHLESYRHLYFLFAFLTSIALVSSRVHYTADCFIAPFFSYISYQCSNDMLELWQAWCGDYGTLAVAMGFMWLSTKVK